MRKLSKNDRGRIAEKIMEIGNLTFLGLVVTQIFPQEKVNLQAILIGVLVLIGSYHIAYKIMKGGGK